MHTTLGTQTLKPQPSTWILALNLRCEVCLKPEALIVAESNSTLKQSGISLCLGYLQSVLAARSWQHLVMHK